MNHELAKKLKDAGFPQDAVQGNWFYNEWKIEVLITANEEGLTWNEYVKIPTLSELIEALGEKFNYLAQIHVIDGTWQADTFEKYIKGESVCYGPTPEEAVAKLWLELNKKQ